MINKHQSGRILVVLACIGFAAALTVHAQEAGETALRGDEFEMYRRAYEIRYSNFIADSGRLLTKPWAWMSYKRTPTRFFRYDAPRPATSGQPDRIAVARFDADIAAHLNFHFGVYFSQDYRSKGATWETVAAHASSSSEIMRAASAGATFCCGEVGGGCGAGALNWNFCGSAIRNSPQILFETLVQATNLAIDAAEKGLSLSELKRQPTNRQATVHLCGIERFFKALQRAKKRIARDDFAASVRKLRSDVASLHEMLKAGRPATSP